MEIETNIVHRKYLLYKEKIMYLRIVMTVSMAMRFATKWILLPLFLIFYIRELHIVARLYIFVIVFCSIPCELSSKQVCKWLDCGHIVVVMYIFF